MIPSHERKSGKKLSFSIEGKKKLEWSKAGIVREFSVFSSFSFFPFLLLFFLFSLLFSALFHL